MTRIRFFQSHGIFYGFEEEGHTGFGEEGTDVLCAALSAMTLLIINAVEVAYEADADYQIDEETTNVRLIVRSALPAFEKDPKKQYALAGLIHAYYLQIKDLTEEYYDFLSVEVEEKDLAK